MSVGERLKSIRKNLNITQSKMANIIGVQQSHLHRYESDLGKLTPDKIQNLYNNGINIEWLITGEGEMFRGEGVEGSENTLVSIEESSTKIPVIDVRASAGSGVINYIDDIKDYITIPDTILPAYTSKKNLAMIEVSGTSMEPLIKDGDFVILDIGVTNIKSGAVYLIRIFDDLRVKRINRKINGNVMIMSDNPVFPPEELTPQELEECPIHIIGMVIASFHNHIGKPNGLIKVR
ncbi:MAG: XRE family transcriptional regulator [Brevinema sp.]